MDGDYVQLVFVGRKLSNNFKCLINFWSLFSPFFCDDGAIYLTFGNDTCSKENTSLWSLLVSLAACVTVTVTQNALNTAD